MFALNEAEFVVFDVETTGLSPADGDRIVEIAALKIRDGQVIDRLVTFVDPRRKLGASEIHGITSEMLKGAPTSAEVMPRMIELLGSGALVAHNASFDIKFLANELALAGRKLRDESPVLDSMKMAKAFLPHLTSYKLGYIASSLGIPVATTHRALADVELLVKMLSRFLAMAPDHNIHTLPEFVGRFGVEKPSFRMSGCEQATFF